MHFSRYLLALAPALAFTACGTPGGASTDSTTGSTGATETTTESTEPTTSSTGTTTESDEPTTTSSSGTTTETTPQVPGEAEACACIKGDSFGNYAYTCPDVGCANIMAGCELFEGECVAFLLKDEAALDCALDRLISGEELAITWEASDGEQGGDGGFLKILPERRGVSRRFEWDDLASDSYAAGVVELKSKEYFEACKAEPELEARFLCAIAWSDEEPDADCIGQESIEVN